MAGAERDASARTPHAMAPGEPQLFTIWEDTVDLKALLIGLACGSALGFICYELSLRLCTAYLPGVAPGVIKGYALLGGIVGCVGAAAGVARVVEPKRHLREQEDTVTDRMALLRSLGVDPEEERHALERASPKLIREMQQLQIHDLFVEYARGEGKAE